MYETTKFSFKYPANLTIKETEKNYFVFVENPNTLPQNSNTALDARLSPIHSDYSLTIKSDKDGLTNIEEQNVGKWLKISGVIKPGFREGTSMTIAFYKYGQGAIAFQTMRNRLISEKVFDQILSTFKFTN